MAFTSMGRVWQRVKAAEVHWKNRRSKVRRAVRRNRALLVTLLAVGGLVALLTGLAMGHGEWHPQDLNNPNGPLPTPRFGAATTYDGATQAVVLFGGFVGTTSVSNVGTVAGPPIVTDGQTYVYRDGGSWQRRDSINRPSARGFAAMAYDGAHKNVVLFGGAPYKSNAVSGETWIWDGFERDWTLVEPPEPRPDPRQNAVMVYDSHHKVVMMFGGRGADGKPMNDTWTWDGSAWTIMPRDGAPSPRHSAAIAYDECNAEAVMFGGVGDPVNNFFPQVRETWTWNGDGGKWTERKPLLSPTPSRIGAGMAYSYKSGRVVLYGGLATTDTGAAIPTAAVDTTPWRWDGATDTWEKMVITDLSPAWNIVLVFLGGDGVVRGAPPPPRAYASFTNLGAGGAGDLGEYGYFNLFGGTPADSPNANVPQAALGDHFIFHEPGTTGNGSVDTDASAPFNTPPDDQNPLRRKCVAPVPLPPEGAGQIDLAAEARSKVTAREGVRETGQQLPVLIGTDWPYANRATHVGSGQNRTPNPNYTPAPECPNRTEGETGQNTRLVTDQKRNRVYQFFICDSDRGSGQLAVSKGLIEAYDGTTLKPLGRVLIGGIDEYQGVRVAHDIDRGRFFLRSSYWNGSTTIDELLVLQQDRIEKGLDPIVKKIDFTGAPQINMDSFFNHPKTGRAKFFFNVTAAAFNPRTPPTQGTPPPLEKWARGTPPKIGQWDIEDWREDWRVELTGCATSPDFNGPLAPRVMRSGNRVYTTCLFSDPRNAVVRINVTEGANGSETPSVEPPLPGPNYVKDSWGDPKTERVFLLAAGGGKTLWVFDGKTSRYVGRVGISPGDASTSIGFDGETARLYVQQPDIFVFNPGQPGYYAQGGLLMIDTSLTPVPQLLKFPQFASLPPQQPIALLPPRAGVPRRVFIRRLGGNMKKYPNGETIKMPNEMFYTVLADEVPVPEKADLSQLDALTIPVAENPVKTEASFDAEGSGYGIRLRSVGGIRSIIKPPGSSSDQWDNIALNLIGWTVPACIFPDRELMAGWVPQARLSDQDAGARSLGLDVDSNSKVDLKGPFSRCNPTANASNLPPSAKPVFDVLWPLWQLVQLQGNEAAGSGTVETGKDADGTTTPLDTPLGTLQQGKDKDGNPTAKFDASTSLAWDRHFKEVECVGDALATNTATVGNIYGSANCVQRQGLVEATARGSAPGVGPAGDTASSAGFSVGEGYSNVTVAREPVRGVVVTATATAKGIQLPNLTIARVQTKAVAWSNGRPSDPFENPRAVFTREICGVVTPDYSNSKCLSSGEQKQMVDNWNARGGTNSKMFLPDPDPDLYQGSPGGYIAGVIKPVADEVEDQIFAKDYQKEVPGLVIEFYKDSIYQGPGRQTLQLAAVRAVAGLGVQCNSELVYSSSANDCVALNFEDDPLVEEFEEEEEFFEDDAELDSAEGLWEPVGATGTGESLGARIGRLLDRLPVLRRLPIRQVGEALLGASVWLLLLTPLGLATRRFALLSLARKV